MEPNEAYARRLLSEADAQIKSGAKLITIIITAMIVWWFTNLSTEFDPSNGQPGSFTRQLSDFADHGNELRTNCARVDGYYQQANGSSAPVFKDEIKWLKANLKEVKSNIGKAASVAVAAPPSQGAIAAPDKPTDSPADKERRGLGESVSKCEELIPKIQKIIERLSGGSSVELEGFKFANIHFRYYPAVLAILTIILSVSIMFTRWKIMRMVDEALQILTHGDRGSSNSVEYISLSRPWWFMVLPNWRYGRERYRLEEVFSPPSQGPITALFLVIVIVVLLLAYRDAMIFQDHLDQLVFGDSRLEKYLDLKDIPDAVTLFRLGHLDLLIIALSLAPLALAILGPESWLPLRRWPRVELSERRALLRGFLGLIAIAGVPAIAFVAAGKPKMLRGSVKVLASPVTSWIDEMKGNRGRRSLRRFSLGVGWYVSGSGTLHFVRSDGTIKGVSGKGAFGAFGENLRAVPEDELVATINSGQARFDRSAYSEGVEVSALNLWDKGKTAAALQLLHLVLFAHGGVNSRRQSNLRLLDLYAGLQALVPPGDLLPLAQQVRGSLDITPPPLRAKLNSRLAAWSNRQGNWYSGWVPGTGRPVRTWDNREIDS